MKIFLDANILADFLSNRSGNSSELEMWFSKFNSEDICISALSVHIAMYVLKIKLGTSMHTKFRRFLDTITILPLSVEIISLAMKKESCDFEDLLQYFTAIYTCDCIVTKDIKDFKKIKKMYRSGIKIISDFS